jgi:hypothetical protein
MNYIAIRHNPRSAIGPKERSKICDEGKGRIPKEDCGDMRECPL